MDFRHLVDSGKYSKDDLRPADRMYVSGMEQVVTELDEYVQSVMMEAAEGSTIAKLKAEILADFMADFQENIRGTICETIVECVDDYADNGIPFK